MLKVNLTRSAAIIVFFWCLIWLSNYSLNKIQIYEQNSFARELLRSAESVSNEISFAIQEVSKYSLNECNEESIYVLKVISNRLNFVYDLGLLLNGRVVCTANWGRLKNPGNLPNDFYSIPAGLEFYSAAKNIFPIDMDLDVTRQSNIVAFTVPNAFQSFLDFNFEFSFEIKSSDLRHTFLSYESAYQNEDHFSFLSYNTILCSNIFNYCVHTYNARPGVFYYSPLALSFIVTVNLMMSFLLWYSLFSFFDKRKTLDFRLKKAIFKQKLYMEYQPILSTRTNKIVGVESLIRWDDKFFGKVSPEVFLSMSEQLGWYPDIAWFTFNRAIKEMSGILKNDSTFTLAINVNSFEVQHKDYLPKLKRCVDENGVGPGQIKIEITERIGLPLEEISFFSRRAKELGFEVLLDDFGTGVANLVWLTEVDFDAIKIDKIFTRSLTNDLNRNIILSIVSLVVGLDKKIIFEGVELEEEYNIIKQYHEESYIQGWYFYKSMPIGEIEKILASELEKPALFN